MKLSQVLLCLLIAVASTVSIASTTKSGSIRVKPLKPAPSRRQKVQVLTGKVFDEFFIRLTDVCIDLNRDKYLSHDSFALHMVTCQNYLARFYSKAVKCQVSGPAAASANKRWLEEEMKANRANGDDLFMSKAAAIRKALLSDPANKSILDAADQRFRTDVGINNRSAGFDWIAWTDKPATVCA